MKCSLYVLRHAKSDWNADFTDDHERPLAPRGVKAAARIGRFLHAIGQEPDHVFCSTAVRARKTLELASKEGGWTAPTTHARELYGASLTPVLNLVSGAGDDVDRLLLVGHEPFCSIFVSALVGGGTFEIPTAGLARIDFDIESWRSVQTGAGQLRWLVTPKILRG